MGKLWASFVVWWQGKKTIVGGCLVMAAGVAGIWYGKLDPVTGVGVVGAGLSIAGFSAKANRHQAELLTALEGVSQAGADVRAGNKTAAFTTAELTAAQLAPAAVAAAADFVPISTDTALKMRVICQALANSGKISPNVTAVFQTFLQEAAAK